MSDQPVNSNSKIQLLAIVWAVVIFGLSSIPSDKFPDFTFSIPDKVAHATVFGVFCYLCYRAFRSQTRFKILSRFALTMSVVLTLIYGITDELHQLFVPGRTSDVFDVAADTVGGLVTALIVLLWSRMHDRSRSNVPPT